MTPYVLKHCTMGGIQSKEDTSNIDFNKKLYIVVDVYLKSKNENNQLNFSELKTNVSLKKHLRDILMNAISKENLSASLSDNNLFLISKKNNDRSEYLELNAIVEFNQTSKDETSRCQLKIQKLKMNILSEFFEHTSNKYGIVVSPNTTVVILYNTLSEIDVYQKKK